jgi:hypothetical protein
VADELNQIAIMISKAYAEIAGEWKENVITEPKRESHMPALPEQGD